MRSPSRALIEEFSLTWPLSGAAEAWAKPPVTEPVVGKESDLLARARNRSPRSSRGDEANFGSRMRNAKLGQSLTSAPTNTSSTANVPPLRPRREERAGVRWVFPEPARSQSDETPHSLPHKDHPLASPLRGRPLSDRGPRFLGGHIDDARLGGLGG